jgi:hypothetical protein
VQHFEPVPLALRTDSVFEKLEPIPRVLVAIVDADVVDIVRVATEVARILEETRQDLDLSGPELRRRVEESLAAAPLDHVGRRLEALLRQHGRVEVRRDGALD